MTGEALLRGLSTADLIIQDVTIDPSREAVAALNDLKSMTIDGRLDYQACDDKVCFVPQSLSLSWSLTLRPLDTERAKKP